VMYSTGVCIFSVYIPVREHETSGAVSMNVDSSECDLTPTSSHAKSMLAVVSTTFICRDGFNASETLTSSFSLDRSCASSRYKVESAAQVYLTTAVPVRLSRFNKL
jgi:hypothetical protein